MRREAALATLLTVNTVGWSLLCSIVFRMPASGLIWVCGPLLCTAGALCGKTRGERAAALAVNLAQFGAIQFLFTVLEPHRLLIILLTPVAAALTARRRCANNAGAVMVASLMNFGGGVFLTGLDTFGVILMLMVTAIPSAWFWERLVFGREEWRGLPAQPPLTRGAVVRRCIAFPAAMLLADAVGWLHGFWIPLTVGLVYSGGATGAAACGLALRRFLWAPVGFGAAVLWLGTLGALDSRFNNLAVVWGILAFYRNFRNDYVGFFLFFLLMISGANTMTHAGVPEFGSGWELFFQAVTATGAAAVIVFAAELDFRRGLRPGSVGM